MRILAIYSKYLTSHINRDQFKLYCRDTGLFVTLAFWDDAFTENVIYQKLLGSVLIRVGNSSISVKSSNSNVHTSIDEFQKKLSLKHIIIINSPFSIIR